MTMTLDGHLYKNNSAYNNEAINNDDISISGDGELNFRVMLSTARVESVESGRPTAPVSIDPKPVRPLRIIEEALVTKNALSHEEAHGSCQCVRAASANETLTERNEVKGGIDMSPLDSRSSRLNTSIHTVLRRKESLLASTHCIGDNTCSICLEAFQVGDKISWSENIKCKHVFHHECIVHWLIKHERCPCCRKNMLNIYPSHLSDESSTQQDGCNSNRLLDTAMCRHSNYCVKHGLVISPIHRTIYSTRQNKKLERNTIQSKTNSSNEEFDVQSKTNSSNEEFDVVNNTGDIELGTP
eukprot:scaffold732_cov48-Attheya_sp.AAC.6